MCNWLSANNYSVQQVAQKMSLTSKKYGGWHSLYSIGPNFMAPGLCMAMFSIEWPHSSWLGEGAKFMAPRSWILRHWRSNRVQGLNSAFYEVSRTLSYLSNMQHGRQDREQRHRIQNIDRMDFPTFRWLECPPPPPQHHSSQRLQILWFCKPRAYCFMASTGTIPLE